MTSEIFSPFDPADHLHSAADVAAFLEAVIDDGDDDPAVFTRALSTIARTQNFSRIAREAGISREGLYRALSADGNPSLGDRDRRGTHARPAAAPGGRLLAQ